MPFTLTETLQSELVPLFREVPEIVRSLPMGTCCPLAGEVISLNVTSADVVVVAAMLMED